MRLRTTLAVLLTLTLALVGCNQEQRTGTIQPTQQETSTPAEQKTTTTAQQAQDGPRQANTFNAVPNPHGRAVWDNKGYQDDTDAGETADGPPIVDSSTASGDSALTLTVAGKGGPGHDWHVEFGSVTITQSITSDVSGEQAQTPGSSIASTPTSTQTPTASSTGGSMVQEPKSSAAVPITVSAAPGSSAQGGSTAAALEGSTGSQSSSNQATVDYLQANLKAANDKVTELMKTIEALKAAQNSTSQPAGE